MRLLQEYAKTSPEDHIDLYEKLVLKKSWWDIVDALAAWNIGQHFKQYPHQIPDYIVKWMNSENLGLQRSCILF